MLIIVTGGAGYIGSHIMKHLLERTDHEIAMIDQRERSDPVINKLQEIRRFNYQKLDINCLDQVKSFFREYQGAVLIHAAALISVPDSVRDPANYYRTNVVASLNLFTTAIDHGIRHIIFSSTAAVYGNAGGKISETDWKQPISPYGSSKLMAEEILQDLCRASGVSYLIFRYFNVAGADSQQRFGHGPKSAHLIKMACEVVTGKRDHLKIFGSETADGSGIRDYIHVDDLAAAHVRGLDLTGIYNLGSGIGCSVREVISTMEFVTGIKIPVVECETRIGDPAEVIADIGAITQQDWHPVHNLEDICRSAYQWEYKTQ